MHTTRSFTVVLACHAADAVTTIHPALLLSSRHSGHMGRMANPVPFHLVPGAILVTVDLSCVLS